MQPCIRQIVPCVVTAFLISVLVLPELSTHTAMADPAPGWDWRRSVEITENSGSPLANYQVEITLHTTNFDYGKVDGVNGEDLRFYQGGTPCDYWIETWNTSGTSTIWVEVPTISTGSTTTIYVDFGNASANSQSSGTATFEFFDDFENSGTGTYVTPPGWTLYTYGTQGDHYSHGVVEIEPFSEWNYRKQLTIDSSKIDSILTDFPVLVKLTSSNFDFSKARSDGYDIRFTTSDNATVLDYERERYNSGSQVAEFWVKIPNISSSIDTNFYMYYDKDNASDGANPTGVWDSNYIMVQHMNDATATTIEDSTSNNNDGTKEGDLAVEEVGQIGMAQTFSGSPVRVTHSTSVALEGNMTIELWISPNNWFWPVLVGKTKVGGGNDGKPASYSYGLGAFPDYTGMPAFWRNNSYNWGGSSLGTDTVATGQWHYIGVTHNTSTDAVCHYLDESTNGTGTDSSTIGDTGDDLLLGGRSDGQVPYWGEMDEVRISNIVRLPAWMKASYYSSSDDLLTFQSEEGTLSSSKAWWQYAPYFNWGESGVARICKNTPSAIDSWSFDGKVMIHDEGHAGYEQWTMTDFGPLVAQGIIRHSDYSHICYIGSSGDQPFTWNEDTWYDYEVAYDGSTHRLYFDDVLNASWASAGGTASQFWLGTGFFCKNFYDDTRLRKHAYPEPTINLDQSPPTVTTSAASNIGCDGVTLNGNLTDKGSATNVDVAFEWGTDSGGPYPNKTGTQTKSATGVFDDDVSGFNKGTTYYYRSIADGDGAVQYGTEQNFTTSTPSIISCTSGGTETNSFAPGETVYMKASGLDVNTAYKVYILADPVASGSSLSEASDPSGTAETVTTGPGNGHPSGGLNPTVIWAISGTAPVTHADWDIVVDDQDGTYEPDDDGLDSTDTVGMVAPISETSIIIFFGTGLLTLVGFICFRRRSGFSIG